MNNRLAGIMPFIVIALFFLIGLFGSKYNDHVNERQRATQQSR